MIKCDYCGEETVFMTSKEFYGWDYGTNVYSCAPCGAYVGTHGRSDKPLGTLANKKLRGLRAVCHRMFDRAWQSKRFSRTSSYKWLAKTMDLPPEKAHIGMFNEEQCLKLISYYQERGW